MRRQVPLILTKRESIQRKGVVFFGPYKSFFYAYTLYLIIIFHFQEHRIMLYWIISVLFCTGVWINFNSLNIFHKMKTQVTRPSSGVQFEVTCVLILWKIFRELYINALLSSYELTIFYSNTPKSYPSKFE